MKKYISIVMLSASVLGLTSCLKDKNLVLDPEKSPSVVEFSTINDLPIDEGAGYTSYSRSFAITQSVTTTLQVHFTGSPSGAPSDVKVDLGVNAAAVTAFNTAMDDHLVALPASYYTLPSSVTIPAGKDKADVTITLNTTDPSWLTTSYVIPLAITGTSAGNVSKNYGTILLMVKAKNAFEASYKATGYVFHPSSPRTINANYLVGTAGVNTVNILMADLGASGYSFNVDVPPAGGALTNYVAKGAAPAAPKSGLMTQDNPGKTNYATAAPDAPGVGEWVSTKYNNTYDAANKTFWTHFGYDGAGNGQNTWTRQFYQKLVRL